MTYPVSYIYDTEGRPEYAVVPIRIWESLQEWLPKTENTPGTDVFDPTLYWGCLSLGDTDVEQELISMRQEWTRNF